MRPALLCLIAAVFISASAIPASASVVLTGTRVIYPQVVSGKTLQLSNADDHPWLVQMWLDDGREDSTPDTAGEGAPFVVSPPIFRIEAHSGQSVRVRFTGAPPLPEDRESLFYLNFSQIPALKPDADLEANRLVLVHKTRVKLFYRPRTLVQPGTRELACGLRFHFDGARVAVENPAAFHAVVSRAEWVDGERSVALFTAEVLAPFSRRDWPLAEAIGPAADAQLRVALVNDYGADERHDCPLT